MNPYIRAVSIYRAQTSHNLSFREYLKQLIGNNIDYFNENDKYNAEREKMRSHLNCIINVNQTRQKKNWTPLIPFTKHEKAWYDGLKLKDMIPSPPSGSSVPRGGSTKKRRNRSYSRKEKRR